MAEYTKNYNFVKPAPQDVADIAELNANADKIDALISEVFSVAKSAGAGIVKEITIPSNSWAASSENPGAYYRDVAVTEAKASQYPIVTIHPESISIAQEAGLSPVCETLEGNIRFSAESSPTNDISATIALISNGGVVAEGIVSHIPIATAETLGGIKIGDGIAVEEDGTASVDIDAKTATDEDVARMIKRVFGES